MNTLLFDIGGTRMRAAVSRDGKIFDAPCIVETPTTWSAAKSCIRHEFSKRYGNLKIQRVSGGIAGLLDEQHRTLIAAPNLRGWVNKPIANDLQSMFHARVSLENDAALGGLGEAVYGAGRKYSIVAFLTVGTGVGGARIVRQVVDARAAGFEPGHQIINAIPRPQTLEQLIGGRSVERRWRKKPWNITSKKTWQEYSQYLGCGLVNVTALWSPDVMVLGGSMFHRPGLDVRITTATLRKYGVGLSLPEVRRGTLGDWAGLWGALAQPRRA